VRRKNSSVKDDPYYWALFYVARGYSVIPIRYRDKKPLVRWEEYQKRRPTEEELKKWFTNDQVSIAIVCGRVSGNLVVLDFDIKEKFKDFEKELPEKWKNIFNNTQLGESGKGLHFYFRLKDPELLPGPKVRVREDVELDIRGEGSYVLVPPSVHPSGKRYKWIRGPPEYSPYELSREEWLELCKLIRLGVEEKEEKEREEKPKIKRKDKVWITLNDDQVEALVKLIKPYYQVGVRDHIHYRLLAELYKLGVDRESRREYTIKLCKETNDEEINDRLYQVDYVERRAKELGEEKLAGLLGLLDEEEGEVWKYFGETKEEAERIINYIRSTIKKIVRGEAVRVYTKEELEEAREEALRILTLEDPLEEIGKLLEDWGIVGEEENKKAIFLLLLSGKIRDPKLKQIILLKGEPGAGKSTLMKIASLFKVKDVGRFTEHALDYTDLTNYEVLRLKEIGHMDEEKQGVSTVKFLSADDQGYTVEYTIRGKDGRFTTETRRIPPITLITSTTRVDLDPQFERRAWIFNADESEEQTKRILEAKARMREEENLKKLGVLEETSKERAEKILRAIVDLLDPEVDVIIPFPRTLTKILKTKKLRVRGDYDKLYSLIYCGNFLLQYRLGVKENNGKRFVIADPHYTYKIIKIIEEPLTSMSLDLEKRARMLIKSLEELDITQAGDTIEKAHREQIARMLGKSERTIRHYFNSWEKAGYVSSEGGRGRPKVYTLLYDLEEIKRREAGVLEELKEDRLIEEMEKEKEKFLEKLNFSTTRPSFSNYLLEEEKTLFEEKRKEKRQLNELPTFQPSFEEKRLVFPQKEVGKTDLHGKENTITFTRPLGKNVGPHESIRVCGECLHYNEEWMYCKKLICHLVSPYDLRAKICPNFKPRRGEIGENIFTAVGKGELKTDKVSSEVESGTQGLGENIPLESTHSTCNNKDEIEERLALVREDISEMMLAKYGDEIRKMARRIWNTYVGRGRE